MCMSQGNRALGIAISIVLLASVAVTAQKPDDGTKKLTIHSGRQAESATEMLLLPRPQELTDADAFPLYAKAVKALPKDLDWGKIRAWREVPVKELPQKDVASVLRSFDAILPLLGRANRHVIALQYIETLRQYATKTGKWPQTLDEIKADLPNDPVTGKPFTYKRPSDGQAILEGPPAAGGDAKKDAIRYELNLAR